MPECLAVEQSGTDQGLEPDCGWGRGLPLADGDCPAILPHPHQASQPCCLPPRGGVGFYEWDVRTAQACVLLPKCWQVCMFTLQQRKQWLWLKPEQAPANTPTPTPSPGVWEMGLWAGKWLSALLFQPFWNLWRITISDIINMFFKIFFYPSPNGFQEF